MRIVNKELDNNTYIYTIEDEDRTLYAFFLKEFLENYLTKGDFVVCKSKNIEDIEKDLTIEEIRSIYNLVVEYEK